MADSGLEFVAFMRRLDELERSPIFEMRLAWDALGDSWFTFRRNYEELQKALLDFEQASTTLLDLRNEKRLELYLREVCRLLHNFLAAAMSLVDHTRMFRKKWLADSPVGPEYDTRIAQYFTPDGLSLLMKALRNVVLHKKVLDLGWTVKQTTQYLDLHVPTLRKELKEESKVLAFLDSMPDSQPVRPLVDAYYCKIRSLRTWLAKRLNETKEDKFAEYDRQAQQIRFEMIGRGFADPAPDDQSGT